MEFTDLELLFIRRMLLSRAGEVQRQINKYQRFSNNTAVDAESKIAVLESEMVNLELIRRKINDRIARIELGSTITN